MKLSILFFPNGAKKNLKTGKTPFYLRIMLNRKKAELRLNLEVSEADLVKWDEVTMRFTDRSMSANAYLNSIEKNFDDFKYHHAGDLPDYNVRMIRNMVMGMGRVHSPLIIHYIDHYYKNTIEPNAQMADGTKRNYRKALTHF